MQIRTLLAALLMLVGAGCATTEVSRDVAATKRTATPQSGSDGLEFFGTPGDGHQHWLNAIAKAKESIVMEMFHLTDPDVSAALLQNHTAQITLILDHTNLEADPGKTIAEQFSKTDNIKVIPSSTSFGQTHTKAAIFDGKTAFITSINLTNLEDTTRDYGVITTNGNIITEMNAVFQQDITNAKNGTGVTPPLSVPQLAWSDVDSEAKLVALINESIQIPAGPERTLYATVENLGDPAIENAFATAAQKGVDVRLIVPQCVLVSGPTNYPFIKGLHTAKLRMSQPPATANNPYMHGKMIVLGNGRGYVGSINFSTHSTHDNRELGMIFTNSSVANALRGTFLNSDWPIALPVTGSSKPPASCAGKKPAPSVLVRSKKKKPAP